MVIVLFAYKVTEKFKNYRSLPNKKNLQNKHQTIGYIIGRTNILNNSRYGRGPSR